MSDKKRVKLDEDDYNEPRTQFVVKDTTSALKIKREERKEAEKRFKAVVEKTKAEQKLELQKMKLQMTAREAASKHIAVLVPSTYSYSSERSYTPSSTSLRAKSQ